MKYFEKKYDGNDLIEAISSGDLSKVKKIIISGVDVNFRDELDRCPILVSCYKSTSITKELVNAGADLNVKSKNSGFTPLMRAVSYGKVKTVELLIEFGADLDIQNDIRGDTALHLLRFSNNTNKEIAKILIDSNANLSIKNKFGFNFYDNFSRGMKKWFRENYPWYFEATTKYNL